MKRQRVPSEISKRVEDARIIIEAEVLSRQSFDDILRPVRQDFAAGGMTEEELETLAGF